MIDTDAELAAHLAQMPDAEAWRLFERRFPFAVAIVAKVAGFIREEETKQVAQLPY